MENRRRYLPRILRGRWAGGRKGRPYWWGGFIILLLLVVAICWRLFLYAPSSGSTLPVKTTAVPISPAPQLHIAGNQLVDSEGDVVRLTGANRSGTEYRCLDYSVFDGPNSQASIDAMLSWHINAIRIPLNEDCWLNINLRVSRFGGDYYRDHIEAYVDLLISNGITPILDLHWSAPGKQRAVGQEPLPDRNHSIEFWKQVAAAYQGDNAVIFDLFNEPFPDNNKDTLTAWDCWKYGTNPFTCPAGTAGLNYEAAGMDELVTAVRNTGATNVILLGGIQYASTLDYWMDFKPDDPLNQLAASWHLYNYGWCNLSPCWSSQGSPLMAHYPVITGEIGEDDRGSDFIAHVMNFLDNPGVGLQPQSYLAWVWNTDQTKYDLINDYSGTPTTPYGKTYMDHLLIIHLIFSPAHPDRPESRSGSSQLVGDRRHV